MWGVRRVAVDATGLGETLARFLARALGGETVRAFKFTAASKSQLGFNVLAAVSGGRLKVYAQDGLEEHRAFQREIELAMDDKLTPNETSLFLTREWLRDDGAMIKEEVRRAQDFIARYVMLDINRTAIPSIAGEDELLETAADQRTVRRIGKGYEAGSYVCSASDVTAFATYGNTIAVARSTVAYVKGLKAQAPKASGGS